jgi:hypothetical protein
MNPAAAETSSVTPTGEASVAKITSLVVKVGALLRIIFLSPQFALDLQLIGGLRILQTFPGVVFGLYTGWFRAPALVLGCAVGLIDCSAMALSEGLVPLHALTLGGEKYIDLYRAFGASRKDCRDHRGQSLPEFGRPNARQRLESCPIRFQAGVLSARCD